MTQSILAAEFTKGSKRIAPVLDITRIENGERTFIECIPVVDKREARAFAKALGATPWNF